MNTSTISLSTTGKPAGKALRTSLWIAQIVLAVLFIMFGLWKLVTPITDLAAAIKWPGEYSPAFVRALGFIDFAGGIGILLPALTRILPRLTVLAAAGLTLLQTLAILFHISRGEFLPLPLNFVLIALAVFVLWGRGRRAPISAR